MDHERNPWTVLASRPIYDNPWISVTEHQVRHPGGSDGIYGVVHFKTHAVGVVPYEAGCIWLVGQYRFPLGRYSWEIPEGGGARDVDPAATARRELLEETGLSADHLEPIVRMDMSNSVTDEEGIVFLATGLHQGRACPEETEVLRVHKVTLDEAFARVESGEIRDSLSVAAIYKLVLMRGQGRLSS